MSVTVSLDQIEEYTVRMDAEGKPDSIRVRFRTKDDAGEDYGTGYLTLSPGDELFSKLLGTSEETMPGQGKGGNPIAAHDNMGKQQAEIAKGIKEVIKREKGL